MRARKAGKLCFYLGPFAQVTDEFGNTFRRGEPTALNIHDWQTLSKSATSESFLSHEPLTKGNKPAMAT